jgi:hypothetical protein
MSYHDVHEPDGSLEQSRMIGSVNVEILLWYAATVLQCVFLVRFWRLGLVSVYPALVISLLIEVAETLVLIGIPIRSAAYTYAYIGCEVAVIGSRVYVVYEICRAVLAGYRGLSVFSRRALLWAVAACLAVSVMAHAGEMSFKHEISSVIRMELLVESTVYTALLVFLLAQALFLLWYPVPLKKNIVLYSFGYSFYFVSMVAGVYLRNQDAALWRAAASMGRILLYDVGLVAWIVLFRKSWEQETGAVALPRRAPSAEGLLARVEALNRALETGRKTG